MDHNTAVEKLILRCKASPIFFIETFCKVKHPKAGVIPFKLFKYQRQSIVDFRKYRFNIYRKTRQSGISTLAGAFALWYAMFYAQKTVLIVSKRDIDATAFLDKNVRFVYAHLPKLFHDIYGSPDKIINEHRIRFPNGSTIQSLTSSKETLRSNSASLNIIDEAAFMPDMNDMWAGGYSCISLQSLIPSEGKLLSVGSIGNLDGSQLQDIDISVQSDLRQEKSDKFYVNGLADTNIITTFLGFKLECTDNHRLKDQNYEWIYSKDIKVGQKLALKCGSEHIDFDTYLDQKPELSQVYVEAKNADINCQCKICHSNISIGYRNYKKNWNRNNGIICSKCSVLSMSPDFVKPKILDTRLAELVGYYVGDGSLSLGRPKRLRLCYDPQDQDIYSHFAEFIDSLNLVHHKEKANGADEFRIDNARFVNWFKLNGFNSKTEAHNAKVPEIILKSSYKIRAAFLRGLFEADGWHCTFINRARPNIPRHTLGFSSISEALIDQVQLMLLDLGIISRKKESRGGYENSGKSWRLELINLDQMILFMEHIGFISKRKNIKIKKLIAQKPTKYQIVENGIFYDNVVDVKRGRCMTVDLSVPSNNTYITNGFVSHNTLMHGGSVIVISTTNGQGNWYHVTWEEAEAKRNEFHPIVVNWWDMDWTIEFKDEFTGLRRRVSPIEGMRKCTTKEEINKWGPYWSPWLEEQYRSLQQRGEAHLFRQEILADFIGTGNTVLGRDALVAISETVNDNFQTVGCVQYTHPVKEEEITLDFENQLWVWKRPVRPTQPIVENGRIIKPGLPGHLYAMGVDISTGEDKDFSAINVIDITAQEQVAELYIKVLPQTLIRMVDYVARWYNQAYVIPERTGIGAAVSQGIYYEVAYPNVYRMKTPSGKPTKKYGFPTSTLHKPQLIKNILDYLGEDGVRVYSRRLYNQLTIFVHLGKNKTGCVDGPGNHDDLPMSMGLALIGIREAVTTDQRQLIPSRHVPTDGVDEPYFTDKAAFKQLLQTGGPSCLMPMVLGAEIHSMTSPQEELAKFAAQLGGIMIGKNPVPNVTQVKNTIHIVPR